MTSNKMQEQDRTVSDADPSLYTLRFWRLEARLNGARTLSVPPPTGTPESQLTAGFPSTKRLETTEEDMLQPKT